MQPSFGNLPIRLVIDLPSFTRNAGRYFLQEDAFAVGKVRRRQCHDAQELIVTHWSPVDELPNGQHLAPLIDWAVIANAAVADEQAMIELVAKLQPKKSHLVVCIILDRQRPERLLVKIWRNGQLIDPMEVGLIGAGMLRLMLGSESVDQDFQNSHFTIHGAAESSNPEFLRESRTVGALGNVYYRLQEMSIAVVGCGRGGAALASQLVSCGLRNLTVIDGDRIGIENLDGMPMIGARELNHPKPLSLARTLIQNQPDLICRCLPYSIHSDNCREFLGLRRFDLVVTCVDDRAARLAASLYCQKTETMHLDVGMMISQLGDVPGKIEMSGDIRLFQPRQGCVACVPEMEGLDEVLYELNRPQDCMKLGTAETWDQQRAGSLFHLNSFVAAVAVELWLNWLRGSLEHSQWIRIGWPIESIPDVQGFEVAAAPGCRFCDNEIIGEEN
ncbi:MAG: ThiF family adenylyltransferase [Planctomycetota bacterium]